jgi:hypothetical protein
MFGNKEKAELIFDLCGMKNDLSMQTLVKLLDLTIEEVRRENDVVEPSRLPYNQGKISVCLQLKAYIERGLPGVQKKS